MGPAFLITIYVGLIGSGKTTICAALAEKARRKGRKVYTNVPEINGIATEIKDFGRFNISNGLVLWDEAGISLNNRKFKSLPQEFIEACKMSRHDHLDMVYFSQAMDIDITLPRLASQVWVIKKGIWFSALQRFAPKIETDEATGQLRTGWHELPKIPFIFRRYLFRPRWYKFFNSWRSSTGDLPTLPGEIEWLRENIPGKYRSKYGLPDPGVSVPEPSS